MKIFYISYYVKMNKCNFLVYITQRNPNWHILFFNLLYVQIDLCTWTCKQTPHNYLGLSRPQSLLHIQVHSNHLLSGLFHKCFCSCLPSIPWWRLCHHWQRHRKDHSHIAIVLRPTGRKTLCRSLVIFLSSTLLEWLKIKL